MDITEADFLTVGIDLDTGREPDELMGYARQPIRLRWDPSSDEEQYVNVDKIHFPMATRCWGRIVGLTLYAGHARIVELNLNVRHNVASGAHCWLEPRSVGFPRQLLVNLYGDRRHTFASFEGDAHRTFDPTYMMPSQIKQYDLEWPRRHKWSHGGEYIGRLNPAVTFDPGGPDHAAMCRAALELKELQHKMQLKDQRVAYAQVVRRFEEQLRAQYEGTGLMPEPHIPNSQLFGVDTVPATPWPESRRLSRELLEEQARALASMKGDESSEFIATAHGHARQRRLTRDEYHTEYVRRFGGVEPWKPTQPPGVEPAIRGLSKVDKLSGRVLGKPPEERKIVVPVPRFWGQLDRALSEPKKAAPPKDMPAVDATPAGAEELIDWARSHEDKVAWAEKLSIPRVTRMLKEQSSYGKTWAESDLVALAG